MTLEKKIAFLGGGNMAEALIRGLIAAGTARPDHILVTDISPDRLEHLRKTYDIIIQKSNLGAAREAGIILLCVKPQVIEKVLGEVAPAIDGTKLVISVAAGIAIAAACPQKRALSTCHDIVLLSAKDKLTNVKIHSF